MRPHWAHRLHVAAGLAAGILATKPTLAESIPGPPISGAKSAWIGAFCPAGSCGRSLEEAWIEAGAFGLAALGAVLWAGRSSASQD